MRKIYCMIGIFFLIISLIVLFRISRIRGAAVQNQSSASQKSTRVVDYRGKSAQEIYSTIDSSKVRVFSADYLIKSGIDANNVTMWKNTLCLYNDFVIKDIEFK